jgi:hypothetical protein
MRIDISVISLSSDIPIHPKGLEHTGIPPDVMFDLNAYTGAGNDI